MSRRKPIKVTSRVLRKLINEEKQRIMETLELGAGTPEQAAKKTQVVDASGYSNSLEAAVDHYKMMKLQEAKLVRQLKKLREAKAKVEKKLLNSIK